MDTMGPVLPLKCIRKQDDDSSRRRKKVKEKRKRLDDGNEEDAYPCPLGYYCEEGTEFPELCPLGTFTFKEGGMILAECSLCLLGYYCNYDSHEP